MCMCELFDNRFMSSKMQKTYEINEAFLKSYSAEEIAPILIKQYDLVPPSFSKEKPHFGEFEIDGIRDVYGLLKSEEITTFIIKWPAGQSNEKLNNFFNLCGWYLAESKPIKNDSHFIKLTYEKTYQEEVERIPQSLYHLTPAERVPKILKNGLVPRSENKISNHPERIYFWYHLPRSLFEISAFADELWLGTKGFEPGDGRGKKYLESHERDVAYSVLRIDTRRCGNDFKIFGDPNMYSGVWTNENIPPQAISVFIEKI